MFNVHVYLYLILLNIGLLMDCKIVVYATRMVCQLTGATPLLSSHPK